ncbi:MAG: efflux RND transporter periplasmic adaptor subunit [Actinomycetota bacterium]|nr:efflux RND transporter periplasmic adaptor subunit [Actinomycetota bacterium]
MPSALVRIPRALLLGAVLAAAAGGGFAVWKLHGTSAAKVSAPVATATRGDVIVSVGGVGRIGEARPTSQISLPSTAGSSSSGAAAPASAPGAAAPSTSGGVSSADAVFPHTSGRVSRLLINPGEHVTAGQPLAMLEDGGSAAGAVLQVQAEIATALVELQQRRTSDPLKGVPPTPLELSAGRFAVTSARTRLKRLLGPPRQADVSAARFELARAKADLETLLGGSPVARARARALAQQNVQLAQQRLDKLLAPPDPADVSAAELELKRAQADLADLQRVRPPASPEALAAAQQAVDAARLKLARALAPASPADVTAARVELQKSQDELRRLEEGPTSTGLAAARAAVAASRAKLEQLLGPPLPADVTAARLDVRKALADLAVLRLRGGPASRFDIELARLKVAAARAKLALARFALRQLTVRAPVGGTVTGLLTVPGAPVDVSTPIATIAALGSLSVSVDLSEFDVAQVRTGLPAVVSVDALGGRSFPGKVLFVGLTGVDSGGVVTFPVRIALQRVAGLKPGMNVSVRIIVARHRNVVHVPLEAVSRDGRRATVAVLGRSGRNVPRRVTLGLANNKDVEIARGLRAGQRVLLAGGGGA